MVKLSMQFPYVKGSTLYDGTKHEVEAIDCVKYSSTNIYLVIYMDHKLNKKSIALFNRGKKNIYHIPLMDKRGLKDLFDLWKTAKQDTTVEELFKNDKDIGVTETYTNLDTFMDDLRQRLGLREGMSVTEFTKEVLDGDKALHEFKPVKKEYMQTGAGQVLAEMVDSIPDYQSDEPESDYYQGRKVTYDGKGPMGLPSSSYWYTNGNGPYGTARRGPGGRPPGPHGMPGGPGGRPPGPPPEGFGGDVPAGPPPEGGPGRHK